MELGEVVNVSGRNSGGTEAGSDQRTQQQWANMAHTPGTGMSGSRPARCVGVELHLEEPHRPPRGDRTSQGPCQRKKRGWRN